MRHTVPAALLLVACQGNPGAWLDSSPPPGAETLTLTGPASIIAGEVVTLAVTAPDLPIGAFIEFGVGTEEGAGPCPYRGQTGGGTCLAIAGVVRKIGAATATADGLGNVSASIAVSLDEAPATFVQAFYLHGYNSASSNVLNVAIQPVYPELVPRVVALESGVSSLQIEASGFRAELDAASGEIADLATGLDLAQQDLTNAESDISTLFSEVAGLTSQLYDVVVNAGALAATVVGLGDAVTGLNGDVNATNNAVNALDTRVGNVENALADLEDQVADQASAIDALQAASSGGSGATQAGAGRSCAQIKADFPSSVNGTFWIDPTGSPTADAFQVQCDFTTTGGPWTLCAYASAISVNFVRAPRATLSGNIDFCAALPNGTWSDKIVKFYTPNGSTPNTWVQAGAVFSHVRTNYWTDPSSRVLQNGARGSGYSLWTVSGSVTTAQIGAPNHGSWCTSGNVELYMHSPADGTIGAHAGVQASLGGCDDNANWKDNFQWQVWTRY